MIDQGKEANAIRHADGNHTMGAGALAEVATEAVVEQIIARLEEIAAEPEPDIQSWGNVEGSARHFYCRQVAQELIEELK